MGNKTNNYTGFIATIIALVTLCSVLTIGFINTLASANQYSYKLENLYQKSFSELITNVNNIEVDLSKIIASTGVSTREKLYNEVYTNCNYASSNLSNLPISYESINQTTKFINQMGGFSYYVGEKLKNGQTLTESDISSTNELYELCKYIQSVLNDFVKGINYNFSILASGELNDSNFNTMFESMQSQNIKYPTLIYDGPFSESSTNTSTKGITGDEITSEQATRKIREIFKQYGVNNLESQGTTTGLFECYNYSFIANNNTKYYVQITKIGGFILNITSFNQGTATKSLSLSECRSKAEEFAKNLSIDVESVWSTSLGGVAYINLTPVVGNVIIYPDMIKAKIDMQNGNIIGWEATSYAHNHTDRLNLSANISIENARKSVSQNLTIISEKLALIPLEYNQEKVTYEFKCSLNDATYYVYIDANNGDEVQVLKVINTSNGNLLQ